MRFPTIKISIDRSVLGQLMLGAALLALPIAGHAKRIAMVVGNDNYQHVSRLEKAGNDAVAMATELRGAGFDVILQKDMSYRTMVKSLEAFYNSIGGGDEVVFFFAGHGVQIKTGGYLLPIDIDANSESEVEKTAYALNDVMERLSSAKANFSLILVDACRDNPLKSNGRNAGALRGLNPPDPPKGQMVVYSASRGQKALDKLNDADTNPNSVFTRELIRRIRQPGLKVDDMVRELQDTVELLARSVSHEQRPAMYNESRGNFHFFAPAPSTTSVTSVTTGAQNSAQTESQREDRFWDDTKLAGNRDGFQAYLDQYPVGRYASLARANMVRLTSGNLASSASAGVALVNATFPTTPLAATDRTSSLSRPPSNGAIQGPISSPPFAPQFAVAPAPHNSLLNAPSAAADAKPVLNSQTRVVLPNQDIFEGETVGPLRQGIGKYLFANGERYEGEFVNNLFQGQGSQALNSGDVYTGTFVAGARSGRGTYKFANGDVYEGEIENNQFHGRAVHRYSSGDMFEGTYNYGEKSGPGVYVFANGDRYEGGFLTNKFHGKGKQDLKSGGNYVGEFRNDMRHGRGILLNANGSRFEGEFINNAYGPRGILIFANGDRYEGEFSNDNSEGAGIYRYASGDRYEGQFKAGSQEGQGIYYYANGDTFTGIFLKGVRQGIGTYKFKDGTTRDMEFTNGVEKPR